MKVLILNVVAKYGSTGKIAQILQEGYQKEGNEVTICYGRQVLKDPIPNSYKFTCKIESYLSVIVMRVFGRLNSCLNFSTKRLLHYIDKENPDLIHILNLHGYYVNEVRLLEHLKKTGIPVIYTMCDEYPYTGKCPFPYDCDRFKSHCTKCSQIKDYPTSWFFDNSSTLFEKKHKIYNDFDNIVFAGCGYVYERAKTSALIGNKQLECVGEPIDLDNVFYPRDAKELRERLQIPEGNKVVLTVAILDQPRKGGQFFIDLCNEMNEEPGYSFVYVGYNTNKYDEKIPEKVIKIPYVESLDQLAVYFSLADVFVSTTLADTVPNGVIDSLGCGTPVCAFNIGGMTSVRVQNPDIVKTSPLYDIQQLKKNVMTFPKKTKDSIKNCRDSIYEDFSVQSVMNKYLDISERLVINKR